MKLKAKDIKVGMRLANESMAVTESRPSLGAWMIHTDTLRVLNPDDDLEVTAVLGKHLKRNMEVAGYGMVNTDTYLKDGIVRVGIRLYGVAVFRPDELVPLDPTQPQTHALDPQKHLLWAVQHKDWAQARAALTEMEKQA